MARPRQSVREALGILAPFARPHYRALWATGLATIGVVLFRLAVPWPLRGVVELVFPQKHHHGSVLHHLPELGDPIVWLGLGYLVAALGVGVTEMFVRVGMKKFATRAIHDLRAVAVESVHRRAWTTGEQSAGDIIARIIGDTARIKTNISGILVHATQNILLFVAVSALMLYISFELGAFFLLTGLWVAIVGFRAARKVAVTAEKQRRKEGDYARAIEEGMLTGALDPGMQEVNRISAKKDVRATALIARSSVWIHVALASTLSVALYIAAKQVAAGELAPGDVFLFIAYAWTVHKRLVQVGRQVARGGKVLANVIRVGALLDPVVQNNVRPASVDLVEKLELKDVKVRALRRHDKSRLLRVSLTLRARQKVLVLGDMGAGKTALLRVLAGVDVASEGTVIWDGEDVSRAGRDLLGRVEFLPQVTAFPRQRLWQTLRLAGPEVTSDAEATLRAIGLRRSIKRLTRGLSSKLSSSDFSPHEARALSLAGILLGGRRSVWLLDDPLTGRRRKVVRSCLDEILRRAGERTLIVAMSRPTSLKHFDQIVLLRRGRVMFSGTPAEYARRKTALDAENENESDGEDTGDDGQEAT